MGVLEELQMKLCWARLQKELQRRQIQGIASNATAAVSNLLIIAARFEPAALVLSLK